MADNYLERRMEEYRTGKLAVGRMSTVTLKRPSMALRSFIIGGHTQTGRKYVRLLRGYGWRVAFTDPDVKSGRELAQSSGSQHHPVDAGETDSLLASIQKAVAAWGAVDVIFDCTGRDSADYACVLESFRVPVIQVL